MYSKALPICIITVPKLHRQAARRRFSSYEQRHPQGATYEGLSTADFQLNTASGRRSGSVFFILAPLLNIAESIRFGDSASIDSAHLQTSDLKRGGQGDER